MEALIRFLFDNLTIVLIVLGILFPLFSRIGRKDGGGRMPDFGGGAGGGMPSRREPPVSRPWGGGDGGSYRTGEFTGGPYRTGTASGDPHRGDGRPEAHGRFPEWPPRPEAAGSGPEVSPREWRAGRRTDAQGPSAARDVRPGRDTSPAAPRLSYPAPSVTPSPSTSPADPAAARAAETARIAPALQVEERTERTIAGHDELRKAIIWAEILGPPRALRPHGRRRVGR